MAGPPGGGMLGPRKEVIVVSTTYTHGVHVRRPHVNLWLVAVIGLAAALVALGAWVLVDRYTGPEHDATTLIDDFNAALSAGDADAVAALITNDFVMRSLGETLTADQFLGVGSVAAERIAPVTVEGDFATTYVTVSEVANPIVSVYQLEDGKIFRLWGFELGSTPPFDNAAMP
jgi:ketosteroid isomerase-like protein